MKVYNLNEYNELAEQMNIDILIEDKDILTASNLYNSLGIPNGIWRPTYVNNGYSISLSDRGRGKTTNVLLWYMCLSWVTKTYGTYFRETKAEITESKMILLFNIINDPKYKYIEKITNGIYNSVKYDKFKRWFVYINTETNEESEPFLYCLAVEDNELYKSALNLPYCIYTLYDEFIKRSHIVDSYIRMSDLLSTIYRTRSTAFISMLANTINCNDIYFHEMMIYNSVKYMQMGDKKQITTSKGTTVFIEILEEDKNEEDFTINKKSLINKLLFGFDNPKLQAITGEKLTWNISNYRHIERTKKDRIINTKFLKYYDDFIRLDLIKNENGFYVHAYPFNEKRVKEKGYYYNNNYTEDRFALPFIRKNKLNNIYIRLYYSNRFMYATNEVGYIIEEICRENKIPICPISNKKI